MKRSLVGMPSAAAFLALIAAAPAVSAGRSSCDQSRAPTFSSSGGRVYVCDGSVRVTLAHS